MIKLFSKNLIIKTKDGHKQSISIDSIRQNLISSLKECGIDEPWISENMIMVIEEQLREFCATHKQNTSEAQLDNLVTAVLSDAGYTDVALQYNKRRNHPPIDKTGVPLKKWNSHRITTLLYNSFGLNKDENSALITKIKQIIKTANFTFVSDELIRQLAMHLLQNKNNPAQAKTISYNNPCLLQTTHLETLFSGMLAEFIQAKIINIHPVSRMFPRAKITLNLEKLAQWLNTKPLTEILILPQLHRISPLITKAFQFIRAEIHEKNNDSDQYPAYLYLKNLNQLIQQYMIPFSPKTQKQFISEIEQIIEQDIIKTLNFKLIIGTQ